ncbi:hypothetical protein HK096_006442 [Nowakowskiella sp. JEL0078]|nr:hypothetical protein HK096_006442 [Nowakowskiella sp. JEL0078]
MDFSSFAKLEFHESNYRLPFFLENSIVGFPEDFITSVQMGLNSLSTKPDSLTTAHERELSNSKSSSENLNKELLALNKFKVQNSDESRENLITEKPKNAMQAESDILLRFETMVKPKLTKGSLDGTALIKIDFSDNVRDVKIPIFQKLETQGVVGCEFENLNDDDCEPLTVALQLSSSKLEYLTISNGELFLESQAVNLLQNCSGLRYLSLFNNQIGLKGTILLKSALVQLSKLEYLSLSGNNFGDVGLKNISSFILQNSNLRGLRLSNTGITNSGAFEIARILRLNSTLKLLWLGGNLFDDDGGYEIASALLENLSLMSLDLRGNRLEHSLKIQLQRIRKSLIVYT